MARKDGEREGARDRPSCPTGRVCRGEKFSHTLSWDATATAGGDEGIPCLADDVADDHHADHVRKDNTEQYRGNYYSLPCGTYRSGQTTVWLQETEGNVELYNKDTGKLICRHVLCTRKGRTVYDDSHRKPRNAGVKIAERILFHVSDNREVAMWMDNLKRRKKRYYRDNPEVILRIIPGYDKNTLIEAIRICLDKGIYNGDSVKSLCEYVCRGKDNGTETYGLEDCLPRQGGLIQSYNEILREYDKT